MSSLSFPILGGHDSTRALQSCKFQNPGGSPEHDEGRTKEILVSDIGLVFAQSSPVHSDLEFQNIQKIAENP